MYRCTRDTFVDGRYYKAGDTAPRKLNEHFTKIGGRKKTARAADSTPPHTQGEAEAPPAGEKPPENPGLNLQD